MKLCKLISILMVICLCGAMFLASCESNDGSSDLSGMTSQTVSDIDSSENEYMDSEGNYVGKTSGKKHDGATVTFLTCGTDAVYESEIIANVETYKNGAVRTYPQIINDDLAYRAEYLEEEYGIVIEEIPVYSPVRKNGEMLAMVIRDSLTQTEDYQVVVPCLYDGAALAMEGVLYNLLELEGLQIEAPWWNQEFNESMTYADQLYFTIGDIGLVNKACTQSLFFNYELWDKYGLDETYGGTPYDLVREGKWTVDVVFEAAKQTGNDLNGDGKIDYRDQYGWSGQLDDMWAIFFGSGEKIAGADADGYPSITMYNERSAKVMEALQDFVQGEGYYVSANDYFSVAKYPVDLTRGAFIEGRTLFFNDAVGTVAMLGNMEAHFGVVPEPKFEESQESYHSLVNPWGSTCFAIPVSVVGDKLTATVDALNILGAVSKNTVAKDYQEVVLSYMKTRDDESAEMINDYILPNRACDVGMVYQWGGLDVLLQEMAYKTVGSFSSQFESKLTAAETALEKTIEFYKEHAE